MAIHLNLWGYRGGGENGSANHLIGPDLIASLDARHPRPHNLTLNEVCDNVSGSYLHGRLNSRGYTVAHWYAHYVSSTCGYFGNLVATQFNATSIDHKRFTGHSGQARTIICLSVQGFVSGQVCSSHITDSNPGQDTQLIQLTQFIQSRPILALGLDLNMSPSDSRLMFLYNSGLTEGTGGPPPSNAPTWRSKVTGSTARLDYIFLNDFYFDPHLPGRFRGPLVNTDHYIYEAFLQ